MSITTLSVNENDRINEIKRFFKDQITTPAEMDLFCNICVKNGLDPMMRQIYPIQRSTRQQDGTNKTTMTIVVGIDGLRAIADRTGNYAPGQEPTFRYTEQGSLVSATAYVKKRTPDGAWHEVSACAHLAEYRPAFKNNFWDTKPHIMLSKCAEALALRKAFPVQMSGLYTKEELDQDKGFTEILPAKEVVEEDVFITEEQFIELESLADNETTILKRIFDTYKISSLQYLRAKDFEPVKKGLLILKTKRGDLEATS